GSARPRSPRPERRRRAPGASRCLRAGAASGTSPGHVSMQPYGSPSLRKRVELFVVLEVGRRGAQSPAAETSRPTSASQRMGEAVACEARARLDRRILGGPSPGRKATCPTPLRHPSLAALTRLAAETTLSTRRTSGW